jgi:electron transfer flavoprotein beta subunit
MKYKHAKTVTEKQQGNLDYTDLYDKRDYLNLTEWSVADVDGDVTQCGLSGSPTKVKSIENIVFQAKENKTMGSSDREIEDLIVELLANHTIG